MKERAIELRKILTLKNEWALIALQTLSFLLLWSVTKGISVFCSNLCDRRDLCTSVILRDVQQP